MPETGNAFADDVVLITGAGSGIGRAGALRFAAAGARVVVADVRGEAAEETVALVREAGGEALSVTGDVSVESDCDAMVELATSHFGKLTVVWANAGIACAQRPLVEIDPAELDKALAVNVRGAWLTARAAVPALTDAGGGSIIFTASVAGLKGRPRNSAYATSKGAVISMSKALAVELAPVGIRVNSLSPVAADTPMLPEFVAAAADPEGLTASMADAIPIGRLCKAEDVADAAAYLASPGASMIAGVNLQVDGAYVA